MNKEEYLEAQRELRKENENRRGNAFALALFLLVTVGGLLYWIATT